MANKIISKIIGLTGPIAAGKNEAAKIFKRRGAYIIDADKIGHNLLLSDPKIRKRVMKTFGVVNREKLGKIVFSNPARLKALNRIMHPSIRASIKKNIEKNKHGKRLIVINAALPQLFKGMVDRTIMIAASKEKRTSRLIKQGRLRADAQKRIAAQMSPKKYIKIADIVLRNDGTKKQLTKKITGLSLCCPLLWA